MNNDNENLITQEELDVMACMAIVFAHSAEKIITVIEQSMKDIYKANKDYELLIKKLGSEDKAEAYLQNALVKNIRNNKHFKFGKLFDSIDKFKRAMDPLTEHAITLGSDKEMWTFFDMLQNDSNFLCRLYCHIANCDGKDDAVKIESMVKNLSKKHIASDRVISLFSTSK